MFAELIFKGFFDFIPAFDFRKIWSGFKVDQPARPDSEETEAKIVASIMEPLDHFPEGHVFLLPDGRYFYALIGEATADMRIDCISQILNPEPTFSKSGKSGETHPYEELGKLADYCTDRDVQRLLVKAYYGKKAAQALLQFSLA